MESRVIARKLAEESIVLLKNKDGVLPFQRGQRVAFFGRTQIDTIYSGNGSGAAHASGCRNILEECEKKGICAEPELKAYYRKLVGEEIKTEADSFNWSDAKQMMNSGIMYEVFGKYHAPAEEYDIPEKLLKAARAYTETAVMVIGRKAGGEECDRHLQGDYYLTDSEKLLVSRVCEAFASVVLILNINGLIDLSWTQEYESIKSSLFIGIPGEEGAAALAGILMGDVNPSGKLAVTIAKAYGDYPASNHFSWDKEHSDKILTYGSYGLEAGENGSAGFDKSPVTVYWEDIYAGYRYFDTFVKEPLYAFGHGLSYSKFEIEASGAVKEEEGVRITAKVKNIGGMAGKETVQCYMLARGENPARAWQELKGFEKTRLLKAGEEEELDIFIPWEEFACYSEESAAYIIKGDTYELRIGNSSRNTKAAVRIKVHEDILTKQCENRLCIRACNIGQLEFLSRTDLPCTPQNAFDEAEALQGLFPQIELAQQEVLQCVRSRKRKSRNIWKEKAGKLTVEQLAAMCVGYGSGMPFSAFRDGNDPATIFDEKGRPLTINNHPAGLNGYVSPAIEEQGIRSVFYKDGPAGVGEIAWPTEMLIACAFNKSMWYAFGNAIGEECERQQVDIWLAPAVNLHRHPLGGRNFEYFSEDPYLTGICACEVAKGVQENHLVLVCPKHFAVNEQETYRRGSSRKNYDAVDSIIRERAVREIYLKPFEMLVKEVGIACIMTSFNKINGVFAGGNKDLCTHILREEWGFEGVVVTDWGDMDIVVDGADAVVAGNDIVMPGGPPVIAQILKGCQTKKVVKKDMEKAVGHLLEMISRLEKERRNTYGR
ncbi:MAG: glycoside hydrolase family 3 C-terminal domain-containing protein [Muribaculaceae bacterium]|nr:glycoside hydrolase family 3 C-terminal domain-containing protein [Roseburia sp.]MCM1429981.1 glycoside hydrolase family 3 C-terminal domain-containing protein [Muribaculaceae bacterium]MCM1492992.1 glycoside hydrolase family 3 C-terminal domain-containing protein [Muribaculaceae bacterium]